MKDIITEDSMEAVLVQKRQPVNTILRRKKIRILLIIRHIYAELHINSVLPGGLSNTQDLFYGVCGAMHALYIVACGVQSAQLSTV